MPSTGWNVFVASLVALVVYIAVQAELVLLGIVAGTLTFVTGWLLGYAINQDLLDSMELSRISVAGGVTLFAIVYTVLYTPQQYILGLIVVCLVWFAAWFTSSMGPIKGDTGAMETIDEPRPPAGAEPGEQLHLGGPEEQYNDDGGGFLGGLLSFGDEDNAEYATEPAERTNTTTQSGTTSSGRTTSEESIFGLGIFYEEEPEPGAGADEQAQPSAQTEPAQPEPTSQPAGDTASSDTAPADQPEHQRRAASADHTRASSTGAVSVDADPTAPGDTEATEKHHPRREPADSPGRETDHPRAGSGPEANDTYRGASTGVSGSVDTEGTSEETVDAETDATAADGTDEPPEEHRLDVADDDGGFIFG